METRIIIAGAGGQGVLFLGTVLAYTAMIEGKEVTCFPSYGAEMRGGTANCTVIISDAVIGSPVIHNADALIAMNDASYQRFAHLVAPGGLTVYPAALVHPAAWRRDVRMVAVAMDDIAGSPDQPGALNMAMLGAFIAVTGSLPLPSVLAALDQVTPSHRRNQLAINERMLKAGFDRHGVDQASRQASRSVGSPPSR